MPRSDLPPNFPGGDPLTEWERGAMARVLEDDIPNLAMVSLRMDCLRLAVRYSRQNQTPGASSVEYWTHVIVGATAFADFVTSEIGESRTTK